MKKLLFAVLCGVVLANASAYWIRPLLPTRKPIWEPVVLANFSCGFDEDSQARILNGMIDGKCPEFCIYEMSECCRRQKMCYNAPPVNTQKKWDCDRFISWCAQMSYNGHRRVRTIKPCVKAMQEVFKTSRSELGENYYFKHMKRTKRSADAVLEDAENGGFPLPTDDEASAILNIDEEDTTNGTFAGNSTSLQEDLPKGYPLPHEIQGDAVDPNAKFSTQEVSSWSTKVLYINSIDFYVLRWHIYLLIILAIIAVVVVWHHYGTARREARQQRKRFELEPLHG